MSANSSAVDRFFASMVLAMTTPYQFRSSDYSAELNYFCAKCGEPVSKRLYPDRSGRGLCPECRTNQEVNNG